jgi:penicillin-binding protein 2
VLGLKPADVIQKVRLCDAKTPQPCWNGSPYQPIPITDEATAKQALQIRERAEDFPGITAEPEAVRRYAAPGDANAAQVLGYLSPVTDDEITQAKDSDSPYLRSDQVGRSGLERQYDKELRGKAGVTRYEVDNLGRVIGKANSDAAEPGSNLVTSIDARVQRVAEYQLDKAMKTARQQFDKITGENYKADSGAVVVMEAKTGRIVAMASAPTYDPNVWVGGISAKDYKQLTGKNSDYPLLNRAIQGQSAPGSTFKVVSTAAAVEAGYKWDGGYPCTSSYSVGGQVFKNFEGENFGPISLGRALEVSCDTGVDLPNEVTGRIPDRKWKQETWEANKAYWCKTGKKGGTYVQQIAYENCLEGNKMREGDSINYSIGQGDTLVTPIQEAMVYGALANGGTEYVPTIGKAIVSADGKTVQEIKPQVKAKLPISAATHKGIDKALAGVVTSGTAAWKFQGWPQDKIQLHAKTGTAEVYGKQTTSWFATYTKDYTVVMTIAQAGTGSGASGEAVRNIYNAMYGVQADGSIDKKKAMLPTPQTSLPKVRADGTIASPKITADPAKELEKQQEKATEGGVTATDDTQPPATSPTANTTNSNTRRRPRRRGGRRMLT